MSEQPQIHEKTPPPIVKSRVKTFKGWIPGKHKSTRRNFLRMSAGVVGAAIAGELPLNIAQAQSSSDSEAATPPDLFANVDWVAIDAEMKRRGTIIEFSHDQKQWTAYTLYQDPAKYVAPKAIPTPTPEGMKPLPADIIPDQELRQHGINIYNTDNVQMLLRKSAIADMPLFKSAYDGQVRAFVVLVDGDNLEMNSKVPDGFAKKYQDSLRALQERKETEGADYAGMFFPDGTNMFIFVATGKPTSIESTPSLFNFNIKGIPDAKFFDPKYWQSQGKEYPISGSTLGERLRHEGDHAAQEIDAMQKGLGHVEVTPDVETQVTLEAIQELTVIRDNFEKTGDDSKYSIVIVPKGKNPILTNSNSAI